MRRILLSGLLLAALAGLALIISSGLHIGLGSTLLGACIGAVLGLVTTNSPLSRVGGFLIGFVITWVSYGIRAQFLPQSPLAQAIAVFGAIAVIAVIAAVAKGKMPFWAFLLGAATMAGAYDFSFAAAPYNFISESISTAGGVLFPVALGMLAAVILESLPFGKSVQAEISSSEPPPQVPPTDVPLTTIMKG